MKEKILTITINKPAAEVFSFCLNPKNTPFWVDSIVKEETNEQPTKLGTIYRNVNQAGKWSEYKVIGFEQNKMFEFKLNDDNYHVRYTLTPFENNSCELEYFEWMENGDLIEPFTKEILEKLKTLIEKVKIIA